jgi:signal transduction histidine kinase
MIISQREVELLSAQIRQIIDGRPVDVRTHREGPWAILRNDVHTLATRLSEQADSLQADRDAMADLLADISHQLKTPLTAMSVMVDLLEQTEPVEQAEPFTTPDSTPGSNLAAQRAEFLNNLKSTLRRTDWLVDNLLKMAKLEAKSVELTCATVHSSVIIERALQPLDVLLDVNELTVTTVGETTLDCDLRWTAEALTNLIKNAIEASPPGATITIASGTNPLRSWISVHDTGSGIPPESISTIFQRFKGRGTGYGIGLSLALSIMEAQSGTIEVTSGADGTGLTLVFFR